MGSKTGWIAMGQEDESSRAGRDGYLGVSGKGEIARHAAQRRRRQKRVGCSTADRRISIINTLHSALRKFFTLSLLGCCCVCNCGHISSLVLMFVVGWNLSLDQRWMNWEETWTLYYHCEGIMGVMLRMPEAHQGERLGRRCLNTHFYASLNHLHPTW